MSTAEGPPPTKAPNNPKPKRPAEEGRQDRRRPPRWTRRRWPRSDLLVGSGHGPGSKAIRLLATHREGPLHRIDARCTRMPSIPCRTNAQVRTRFCASRPGPAPLGMPRSYTPPRSSQHRQREPSGGLVAWQRNLGPGLPGPRGRDRNAASVKSNVVTRTPLTLCPWPHRPMRAQAHSAHRGRNRRAVLVLKTPRAEDLVRVDHVSARQIAHGSHRFDDERRGPAGYLRRLRGPHQGRPGTPWRPLRRGPHAH